MELLEGDRLRNPMGGGAGETELAASKILLLGRDTPLVLKIGQAGLRDPQKPLLTVVWLTGGRGHGMPRSSP